jgi:hypothetical protein
MMGGAVHAHLVRGSSRYLCRHLARAFTFWQPRGKTWPGSGRGNG